MLAEGDDSMASPPERCPTCDREGCRRAAAVAAYQASRAGDDALPLALDLVRTERECLDLEVEVKRQRRAREVAEEWRAFCDMRLAASKWARVEPLIERLRTVMVGIYGVGDAPLQEYRNLAAAVDQLLAAGETP